PYAALHVAFPISRQGRHTEVVISELNTWPVCTPVNASPASLRMQAHDSGPRWCATPFLCGSLIRYSLPVYPGAFLDHPVRPRQNIRRNRQADLLCRFEIDDELELHRLFHWQVGRLAPFKNLVHVGGSAPVNVSEIDPISHESAVLDKLPRTIHCRQAKFAGEFGNPR